MLKGGWRSVIGVGRLTNGKIRSPPKIRTVDLLSHGAVPPPSILAGAQVLNPFLFSEIGHDTLNLLYKDQLNLA